MSHPTQFLTIIDQALNASKAHNEGAVVLSYPFPTAGAARGFMLSFYRWRAKRNVPAEAHNITIAQVQNQLRFTYDPNISVITPLSITPLIEGASAQGASAPLHQRPSGAPIPNDPGNDIIKKLYGP